MCRRARGGSADITSSRPATSCVSNFQSASDQTMKNAVVKASTPPITARRERRETASGTGASSAGRNQSAMAGCREPRLSWPRSHSGKTK